MADDRCPECGGYRGLPRMLHDQDTPRECSNEFHKESNVVEFKVPQEAPPAAEQEQPPLPPPEQLGVQVPMPKCPHCDADDGGFYAKGGQLAHGRIQLVIICCKRCHKPWGVTQVLELQMVPMSGPTIPGLPGGRPM